MSAHNEYWCFGSMTLDRTQPEVQTSMFKSKSTGPQKHVDCPPRQEELKQCTYVVIPGKINVNKKVVKFLREKSKYKVNLLISSAQ